MRPKIRKGEKVLRPLHPNAGVEAEYRRKLYDLVEDMVASVERWIAAAYRKAEPKMAQDAERPKIESMWAGGKRPFLATINGEPLLTAKGRPMRFATEIAANTAAKVFLGELLPADLLQTAMKDLGDYWLGQFDEAAPRLARWFAKSSSARTDEQLKSILRDGGWTVRFKPSSEHMDVLRASVHENVALIRSIPEQYLKNVEGMVMRSVQRGRDIGTLTKDLQKQYGVTRRRAALIARDQNNKATSAYHEARRTTLGIEEAVWMHSHGGREPRPTHVKMDGKRYKVAKGMWDSAEGKYVWPGELINCRCVSRSIIPALDQK